MPYIDHGARKLLDESVDQIPTHLLPGQLNYLITRILMRTDPRYYSEFNTLVGVLECVKLEMYRRAVAPYEDEKCSENGDVFK